MAQRVLKGDAAGDDGIVRRVSAAEIEAAVVGQIRALLRQRAAVIGTWMAARGEAPDLMEGEAPEALAWLDPLWGELSRPSRREPSGSGGAGGGRARRSPHPPTVEGLAPLVPDLAAIALGLQRTAALPRQLA